MSPSKQQKRDPSIKVGCRAYLLVKQPVDTDHLTVVYYWKHTGHGVLHFTVLTSYSLTSLFTKTLPLLMTCMLLETLTLSENGWIHGWELVLTVNPLRACFVSPQRSFLMWDLNIHTLHSLITFLASYWQWQFALQHQKYGNGHL